MGKKHTMHVIGEGGRVIASAGGIDIHAVQDMLNDVFAPIVRAVPESMICSAVESIMRTVEDEVAQGKPVRRVHVTLLEDLGHRKEDIAAELAARGYTNIEFS